MGQFLMMATLLSSTPPEELKYVKIKNRLRLSPLRRTKGKGR
jgi:hypothetical protein